MEQTINSFNKGMNSDLALTVPQAETALNIENFRVVTDNGSSTFALANVKGMNSHISYPTTSSVNTIVFTGAINDLTPVTISFDGNTDTFTPTTWNSYFELYQQLAAFINASATIQAGFTYTAYAQPTQVLIYSPNGADDITIVSLNPLFVPAIIISKISDFYTIGWTTIRDSIVLITTNNVQANPGGVDPSQAATPPSAGQIWLLTHDPLGVPTLTLKYNNIINLTAEHPIPSPGAIVGRYESPVTQRIYWTDNFNKPRRFNIADINCFGTSINELLIQSNISFGIPKLQHVIQSGSVLTGMHQYAYRLKSNSGSETVFSLPSNLISVTASPEETGAYVNYIGSTPNLPSGKSIELIITGLDRTYDRIEVVDIYYEDATTTVPAINIILDEPIPTSGTYVFKHTGNETEIPITPEEFSSFNPVILTVKTMVSKNNRLIEGNIKESRLDVNYDARAFRFDSSGNTYVTPADIANPKSDCINPNQSPIPHDDGFIYQDPNLLGFLAYGGTGANISYEFIPTNTDIDNQTTTALNCNIRMDQQPPNFTGVPYAGIGKDTYSYDTGAQVYPVVNTYRSFATPYVSTAIKGYMRDEIYRFAILFYDLLGNPGFANWIADIRMPHSWMPNPSNPTDDTDRVLAFPKSRDNGFSSVEAFSLGIKFNINLTPEVIAQISGFSIVRVERKSEDKTILGQGVLEPSWIVSGDPNTYLVDEGFDPRGTIGSTLSDNAYGNGCTNLTDIGLDFASFFSPDHLFGKEDFNFVTGDALDIVAVLEENAHWYAFEGSGVYCRNSIVSGVDARGWVVKNYTYVNTEPTFMYSGGTNYYGLMPLRACWTMENPLEGPQAFTYTKNDLTTPTTVFNVSPPRTISLGGGGGTMDASLSSGPKKLVVASGQYTFGGNSFGNFVNLYNANEILSTFDGSGYSDRARALLVNYKRSVAGQYGGNTYNSRSNSIYISTGHYQPITPTSGTNFVHKVFGGDTFIECFEFTPRKKNLVSYFNVPPALEFSTILGRYIAVETCVNSSLRKNNASNTGVLNKNYFSSDVSGVYHALDIGDYYEIESVYSRESSLYPIIAKPDPFTELFDFDNRIRASEQKENGEFSDSWSTFKPATYIDVEGIYGPINNLIIKDDKLFYFQDKAFGEVAINTRALIQDQNSNAIQLGAAGLLSRFDYISTEIGCKHQWGMLLGNSSIYFMDANTRKIYKFNGDGIASLGELKGMIGYLNNNLIGSGMVNDNPILGKGMTCTFDYKFNEAIFTFHTSYYDIFRNQSVTNSWTLSYNELIQAFNAFYGFQPPLYVNSINRILSSIDNRTFYLHNVGPYCSYYGATPQVSKVKWVINPDPSKTKKYDVFKWITTVLDENTTATPIEQKDDTWTTIKVYDNFQNSGLITLIPKPTANFNVARNKNREWTSHVPRNAVLDSATNVDIFDPANLDITQLFKPRMYDNYLISEFEYDNINNYKFISPFIITEYR